jgi:hypothetical protein
MKVICDCGTEMTPVVDENGKLEYWFPVVTLHFMGRMSFEGRGFFFDCPKCKQAVVVSPR